MNHINPTLDWYKSISKKKFLTPRCPFAFAYKCPKYFYSLSLLKDTGATEIYEEEERKLEKYWKKIKLYPILKEDEPAVSSDNDEFSAIFHFCPEVTHLRFGYFAEMLSILKDEIDIHERHRNLGEKGIDGNDWRWYFQYLTPLHYTDCSYYSILLKNPIDQKSGIDEIELTDSQSADYKKYKYKCYYKINIIGKDEDLKKENYIEIDGNGVSLSENNFLIFMRLILERRISDEGWVDIKKFIEETELELSGHYQLISRLRQNLQKILNEKETKELIKNKKSGLYRISTHPDFIIYRKKDLIKNYSNNKYITQIVNQLPEI